jgi:hypothetical protein
LLNQAHMPVDSSLLSNGHQVATSDRIMHDHGVCVVTTHSMVAFIHIPSVAAVVFDQVHVPIASILDSKPGCRSQRAHELNQQNVE